MSLRSCGGLTPFYPNSRTGCPINVAMNWCVNTLIIVVTIGPVGGGNTLRFVTMNLQIALLELSIAIAGTLRMMIYVESCWFFRRSLITALIDRPVIGACWANWLCTSDGIRIFGDPLYGFWGLMSRSLQLSRYKSIPASKSAFNSATVLPS